MSEKNKAIERDADFTKLDSEETKNTDSSASEAQGSSLSNDEVSKLRLEVDELKEKYLRSLADFENYQRRAIKERSDLVKYQGSNVFLDLLDVIDSFDRAMEIKETDLNTFRSGIEMIRKLFLDILAKFEVRAESGIGQDFSPFKHEAISQVAVDDAKPGTVINELRKAYFYKDKLLRPAQVVVAAARVEPKPVEKEEDPNSAATDSVADSEKKSE